MRHCVICGAEIPKGAKMTAANYALQTTCPPLHGGWSPCKQEELWRKKLATFKRRNCEICGQEIEIYRTDTPSRYSKQCTCRGHGKCWMEKAWKTRRERNPDMKTRPKPMNREPVMQDPLFTSWYDRNPPKPQKQVVKENLAQREIDMRYAESQRIQLAPAKIYTPAEIAAIAHEITPVDKIPERHGFIPTVCDYVY